MKSSGKPTNLIEQARKLCERAEQLQAKAESLQDSIRKREQRAANAKRPR